MTESSVPVVTRTPRRISLALIVALIALGVSGWQWYETRRVLDRAELDLAKRLAETSGLSVSARAAQSQSQQAIDQLATRLNQTEARVAESAGQYATLQSMYAELTKNREDWQQAEIEHALTIASQQLELAGNVPAAIAALENIDARLANQDKPQYIALRRGIGHDLEALKALPYVDVVGLSVKLDRLVSGVDTLPLVVDGHRVVETAANGKTATPPATAPATSRWREITRELWNGFTGLIRIQNMDKPDALLLSPEQAFFLRENLKLRLLDARLALLQRDSQGYKTDLGQAQDYARRYFDTQTQQTAQWLQLLDNVASSPVSTDIPSLDASLKAARALLTPLAKPGSAS